jgi:hypothetical protein
MVDTKKHFKDVFVDVTKMKEEGNRGSLQSLLNPGTKVELVEKKTVERSGKIANDT